MKTKTRRSRRSKAPTVPVVVPAPGVATPKQPTPLESEEAPARSPGQQLMRVFLFLVVIPLVVILVLNWLVRS